MTKILNKITQNSANNKRYYQKYNRGYKEFIEGKSFHKIFYEVLKLIKKWSKFQILDVGCGRGEVIYLAAKNGYRGYGIDNSPEAVNLSLRYKHLLSKKEKSNYIIKKMDAKNLKFKNGYFDTVLALDITEHLYDRELEEFLREANRVLCSNGKLIIHTPNSIIMKPAIFIANLIGIKLIMQDFHVNEKDIKSLEKILQPYFKIEKKWFEKEKNFWSGITINRGLLIRSIAWIMDKIFDNHFVDSLIRKSFLFNFFGNGIWIVGTKLPY